MSNVAEVNSQTSGGDDPVGLDVAWRRFWFTPGDPRPLAALRIAVGLIALLYVFSHTLDLALWFGHDGILTIGVVQQLTGADQQAVFRPSYFFLVENPIALWTLHGIGLLIAGAMTAGWFSRWSTPLTLAVVLSYAHRGPMITGPLEPVLTFSLFYLSFAPSGVCWSVDAWRRARRNPSGPADDGALAPSWTANFALRMLQVHVAALYLLMALTKLAAATWWQGDAVWWLSAYPQSRLVDLTGLLHRPLLFSAATHAVVMIELAMATLIWNRGLRPALIVLATLLWIGIALLTGMTLFCLLMILLNLAFAPLRWLPAGRPAPANAAD